MTAKSAYREEAADDRPMTRPALEDAAKKHGVTTSPSMSDRAIAEAVVSKIEPNTFNFAGKSDVYTARVFELTMEQANKAAEAKKAPAPAAVEASAPPRQEAPARPVAQPRLVDKDRARDAMIRRSLH